MGVKRAVYGCCFISTQYCVVENNWKDSFKSISNVFLFLKPFVFELVVIQLYLVLLTHLYKSAKKYINISFKILIDLNFIIKSHACSYRFSCTSNPCLMSLVVVGFPIH